MTSSDVQRPADVRTSRRPRVSDGAYDHLAARLAEFYRTDHDGPRRRALRDELATGYLPVVRNIARRYSGRGESVEDLEQVGVIGMLNALERFDPSRGVDFLSYLIPTVTGEVRRHFRDRAWSMRVPRRLKDLQHPLRQAVEELSGRLRRAPRPSELAAHLGLAVEEVVEALQAQDAYSADSLDAVVASTETPLAELLGGMDKDLDAVEYRDDLRAALDDLPERERTIIMLRFFGNLTQTQIADRVGVSQMHVSRLLAQTLATLRTALDAH